MSNSTLTVSSAAVDKQQETAKAAYNEKNPFRIIDDEGGYVEQQDSFGQPPTTKWELWSYYLYYNGDNGYTIYSFMPLILQSLAYNGGFYPETPNIKGCDVQDTFRTCYVAWMGSSIPVSSMLLYVQAIAFSIQFLLFTTFGSLADYGQWNRYILLGATIIGCTFQALPIVLVNDDGSHWNIMMGIMNIALISYGTSLVFYAAAFPNVSDNLPVVRHAKLNPNITASEQQQIQEKWRNQVSAVSTTFSNVGFLVTSGVLSAVSFVNWEGKYAFPNGVGHTLGNAPVYNYISTVVCACFWAVNAIPYFLITPRGRKGPPLPADANYFTFGWKSIILALKEARKLRYLFMYIFAYFMFSDAVSTISQMLNIIQGELTGFSAQQNAIFSFISAVTSILGCLFFLWLSKTFHIRTKTSLLMIVVLTSAIPTHWELWVLNVWSGLFTAPIWAWQQTMLAELVPKGKENLFFGLFGVVNKASSWIGPVVIGAITQSTSNIWKGWPFVLGLFILATVIICFIDVDKAKLELSEYEKAE
ncbi:MFS general substrate transporter [Mucor ambiguus]|uniref:Autophagy-related protein n=1 Tax=Mucor ambiguus TaxID=91626 RepID=A0A0C9M056_9FUNG|nr:MFS general substrate transporter [Mucor ambiguus]